jgi:hypothetical protein
MREKSEEWNSHAALFSASRQSSSAAAAHSGPREVTYAEEDLEEEEFDFSDDELDQAEEED